MLILAFDTTAAACSVALWRDGETLKAEHAAMTQGQAEALIPMIERLLSECRVEYAMLDCIAVTVGPGSFTGVRVGIATARALGLAASKPVVGVKTTEVLAAAMPETPTRILAVMDTKRGDLYVQMFGPDRSPVSDVSVVTLEELPSWAGPDPVTLIGDGAALAMTVLGPNATLSAADPLPDAAVLARLACTRAEGAETLPVYARAPDAKLPTGGGRLRP
tara:strand:- start:1861 stop:2520 length:660 start_codon:yes stop_codon:yes gene_type:complete